MKKTSGFRFWLLLALSIIFVAFCFVAADNARESARVGGEVFTIALPLWVVSSKLEAVEQDNLKLKQQNEKLMRILWQDM